MNKLQYNCPVTEGNITHTVTPNVQVQQLITKNSESKNELKYTVSVFNNIDIPVNLNSIAQEVERIQAIEPTDSQVNKSSIKTPEAVSIYKATSGTLLNSMYKSLLSAMKFTKKVIRSKMKRIVSFIASNCRKDNTIPYNKVMSLKDIRINLIIMGRS